MLSHDSNPKRNKPNFALEYLRYHLSFYKRFWGVFGGVLALDQLTKFATMLWLPETYRYDAQGAAVGVAAPPTSVIPGFFDLVHVYNEGAAFSIMKGWRWPLVLLAVAALAGIFRFRRQLEMQRASRQWMFGLLTGGIFGNVLDRMLYGKVVDFLDFNLPLYGHWPAFNIADCGICAGAVIYIFASLRENKPPAQPAPAASAAPPTAVTSASAPESPAAAPQTPGGKP